MIQKNPLLLIMSVLAFAGTGILNYCKAEVFDLGPIEYPTHWIDRGGGS